MLCFDILMVPPVLSLGVECVFGALPQLVKLPRVRFQISDEQLYLVGPRDL